MPDYTSGFTGAINDQNVRDYRTQQIQQMQQAAIRDALVQKRVQDQQAARAVMGRVLMGMGGQQQLAPPPVAAVPPPGTTPGPLPPGVGTPSVPMTPPVAAASAAPVAEPPIPPYQALPAPPADTGPDTTGGDTELAAPPGNTAPAAPAAPPAPTYSLQNMIKAIKAQGVPDAMVMDMLDAAAPMMNAQNKQELDVLRIHNLALQKAQDIYMKTIDLAIKNKRADTQATDVGSKIQRRTDMTGQGQQRIDLAKQKMSTAVGGADNVKRSAPVYDADGTQIGWNVLTKGGQTRNFDLDGNARDTSGGQPGPKADVNNLRKINSLNSRLNTLNNLIKKTAQDQAEMENIKGQLRAMGAKVAAGGAAAPAAAETKVLNGKTYVKKGGQWYAK
jgi:hypothetical protein